MKTSIKVIETKNGKVSKITHTNKGVVKEFKVAKSGLVLDGQVVVGKLRKPKQRWFNNIYLIDFYENEDNI